MALGVRPGTAVAVPAHPGRPVPFLTLGWLGGFPYLRAHSQIFYIKGQKETPGRCLLPTCGLGECSMSAGRFTRRAKAPTEPP